MTRIRVIVDLDDSLETTRKIHASARPTSGVVVVAAPAGRRPAGVEACSETADALAAGDPWTMQRWVPALLGRLIRNRCRQEAVVRLRAAQATFFTHGWRLRVDDRHFAALLAQYQPSQLDGETLTLLCGYLEPQPAAAAAARILVGHQARLLTLNDLAADAASIRTADGTISIPEAARIVFLAHLELRRSEGADTIAPLIRVHDHLRNDYADRHLNEHQWRDLLQSTEVDTGLSGLSPREPPASRPSSQQQGQTGSRSTLFPSRCLGRGTLVRFTLDRSGSTTRCRD